MRADQFFTFTLTDDARVLTTNATLDNVGDFDEFRSKYMDSEWSLDFEKLEKDYDAIEYTGRFASHIFTGWDCNSILVMNPDVIIEGGRTE